MITVIYVTNVTQQNTFFKKCQSVTTLGESLINLLTIKSINIDPFFKSQIVLYGYISENKIIEYLIDNIIVNFKFYIHKCRFGKSKPPWTVFK